MEYNKEKIDSAIAEFTASVIDRHNNNSDTPMEDITSGDAKELKSIVANIGQRNTTGLGVDESAEFFTKEQYEKDIDKLIRVTRTTSSNGRTYDRVYAAANRFYKNGQSKIGEHIGFIDVTGMIRQHFSPEGFIKNEEGKLVNKNPVRVDDKGDFNTKMRAQRLPWNMLTEVLAGHTVTAKLSTDKQIYQDFSRQGRPLETYSERNYSVYSLK